MTSNNTNSEHAGRTNGSSRNGSSSQPLITLGEWFTRYSTARAGTTFTGQCPCGFIAALGEWEPAAWTLHLLSTHLPPSLLPGLHVTFLDSGGVHWGLHRHHLVEVLVLADLLDILDGAQVRGTGEDKCWVAFGGANHLQGGIALTWFTTLADVKADLTALGVAPRT